MNSNDTLSKAFNPTHEKDRYSAYAFEAINHLTATPISKDNLNSARKMIDAMEELVDSILSSYR